VKGSTEITAWTGKLPKALHKLTGRPLNEETTNALTKPGCYAIMVSHLAAGHSSTWESDKKPKVVAAFLEEARRRNWTPPAAGSVPAPVKIETAGSAPSKPRSKQ
jgi:hypothetical protein